MAYTNPTFDPTVPADGDFLDQGDDSIRSAKLDVKERLESFFKSFDDDPLVPKDASIPFSAVTIDPSLNFKSILFGFAVIAETIAAGAIGGGPETVTGAEPGDLAFACWPDGRFAVMCAVTAPDTVTVAITNITAGSITLSGGQLQIMVVKPGIPGQLHGELNRVITHTAFQPNNETDPITYTDVELVTKTDPVTVFAEVSLPAGQTIVRVTALVRTDDTATLTGQMTRYPAVGAPVLVGLFAAVVGAGVQELVITPTQIIAAGDLYGINFTLDATGSANPDDAGLAYVQILMT